MKGIRLILAAVWMAACAAPAPAAESLSDTLQKGLFEEEANHNLDAAIKAYQTVITGHEEQRRLTATAVFRLGECYRKLGKTNEAAAQYQRVLSEFLDQPALANLSRQNLVGLGLSSAAQPTASASAPDKYRALAPAARTKLKELLQEQIRLAEKNLAEQRKRVEVGTMAPEELFRFQKEVLSLKREQLLVDGLGTPESREQWQKFVLEEIDLAEKALATERRKGTAAGRCGAGCHRVTRR
jgi:tetratricopeptide (TPR) repeat protein